jgi:hypothetical protein
MKLEGTTNYQIIGETAAYALAQALISESAAFVFQPRPFDVYHFSVRDKGCAIAQRFAASPDEMERYLATVDTEGDDATTDDQ